jgi:type 1 fimbria pilin
VTTTALNVTLPDVPVSQLNAVGATAGNRSFEIGLSCPSTGGGDVYVTFTDATAPANVTDVLSPASGSTATGVACAS